MKVSVVGPESSGTRLMVSLLDDMGVEAVHRSVPYGPDWWPERGDEDATHTVIMLRDPDATMKSQQKAGHLIAWPKLTPEEKYNASLGLIVRKVMWNPTKPFYTCQYERLVADVNDEMYHLALWLEVEPKRVTREIVAP